MKEALKKALKKAQEYALKTGLYLKGNVLEKVGQRIFPVGEENIMSIV